MDSLCDLHTHSTFSDGTLTPARIVAEARAAGLRAVALTDHNTVAGLPEFLDAARGTDVQAIPGVEISTGYCGKELHIVGLFIEPEEYDALTRFLRVISLRKDASNRALVDALCRAGFQLDYAQIAQEHPGSINRAVIASELLRRGFVGSIREAIQTLLSEEHGYYVPPERISPEEAIRFLRSIGAVPVLAHPFISLSEEEIREFLPQAKLWGLAAMETRYPAYSPETARKAARMAREFGLLESGGSDFHGENKPGIRLGTGSGTLSVPYALAEKLARARAPQTR